MKCEVTENNPNSAQYKFRNHGTWKRDLQLERAVSKKIFVEIMIGFSQETATISRTRRRDDNEE